MKKQLDAKKLDAKKLGKKPSGWEYELRRRDAAAKRREEAERETGATAALASRIGEPPVEDPELALSWYRRAQLVLLGEVLKDPSIAVLDKFTAVKQMSEAAGKTHRPAGLEERLAAVEEVLHASRPKAAVEVKPTDALPAAPTARGGSRSRRPRPMAEPPPGSDEPERGPDPHGGGAVG